MPKKKVDPFKTRTRKPKRGTRAGERQRVPMGADGVRADIIAKMCSRARWLQREIERSNELRGELSAIVEELLKVSGELPSGVALVDTYADKNKRWKSVCMERFELAFSEDTDDGE